MPRVNGQRLKLFVWTEFCPDFKGGLAFAIAHTEKEARDLVEKEVGYPVYEWGTLTTHRLDRRMVKAVTGGS